MGFSKIGFVGLGLIGGSLAKGFKKQGYEIYGYDISDSSINICKESGIFKYVFDDFQSLLDSNLDLLYITTPVEETKKILDLVYSSGIEIKITDASSTKKSICDYAAKLKLNFCGGHPIAGKETSGFEYSDESMFDNAYHILIDNNSSFCSELADLHRSIGMRIDIMSADEHDLIFALISHAPHIISFGLIELVREVYPKAFGYTGGGFKDFTRIAASDPKMWTDIFMDNKDNLLNLVDKYIEILQLWKSDIAEGNYSKIFSSIEEIRNIRRGLK